MNLGFHALDPAYFKSTCHMLSPTIRFPVSLGLRKSYRQELSSVSRCCTVGGRFLVHARDADELLARRTGGGLSYNCHIDRRRRECGVGELLGIAY